MKTKCKLESVELQTDGSYLVRINTPPIEGRANVRVIELLAKFLGKPKSVIHLKSGSRSKKKIFEVTD